VAVQYASADGRPFDAEVGARLVALACSDEREAGIELMARLAGGGGAPQRTVASPPVFTVQRTTLAEEESSGEVVVSASLTTADGAKKDVTDTLKLRKEGDEWCVVTGWAEAKRLDGIAGEIDRLDKEVSAKLDSWDIDGARSALAAAEKQLNSLPEDRRTVAAGGLTLTKMLLDVKAEGWVGGRWVVSSESDPMTDEINVVARLQSTTGLPNRLGREEPTQLIVRCDRNKLDLFIVTKTMLDADWQYASVVGQSRFGKDAPSRLSGARSEDYNAVFLRNPRDWMEKLRAHEADEWAVELPIFQRSPATMKFDLAATSKALSAIPATCR
jgi:hypothetical protein